MLFHKTSHKVSPSVTDYETMKARMKFLKSSPKAVIGNAQNVNCFALKKVKDYVSKTTHQYVQNYDLMARNANSGTFYNSKRWKEMTSRNNVPGVGLYDVTKFKSMSKASETTFEFPKYLSLSQLGAKPLAERRILSASPARSAGRL